MSSYKIQPESSRQNAGPKNFKDPIKFGAIRSQQEVANILGISSKRVSQLEFSAMRKIKRHLAERGFAEPA